MLQFARCVLLVFPFVLPAQNGPTGLNAISAKNLRADLTFLTSDALEGRLSLQRGSEVAIQWIVAEFTKMGLQPANGKSFLQPVPLIEYRTDRRDSLVILQRGTETKTYSFPEVAGGSPNDVEITAPVAFAGFGITAPELQYDDYEGLDAKGKIVLVFDHEPQENDPKSVFNGVGNTRYASSYVKALNAQKRGAVAVLIVSEPNRKHPSNQERMARIRSDRRRSRIPSQALIEGGIQIPVISIGDKLAADLLASSGKKSADLQRTIDSKLRPASLDLPDARLTVRLVNSERRRGASANVVGMLEGSDPQLKNDTIIFSAHYDHDGLAESGMYAGADDNGSGTVGVVELARAFCRNGARPKRSLLFAIFAAEERGLLGSYYYAAHPLRPLATTRAVINFDMIGRNETPSPQTDGLIQIAPDTSNELNLIGTIYSPDYREIVEKENKQTGLTLNYKWDRDAALNIFFRSDQYPFALHGIPAVWWFTGFHPDYHQTSDTVDKINFEKMEKILRLAYRTGWAFSENPNAPRFVALRE